MTEKSLLPCRCGSARDAHRVIEGAELRSDRRKSYPDQGITERIDPDPRLYPRPSPLPAFTLSAEQFAHENSQAEADLRAVGLAHEPRPSADDFALRLGVPIVEMVPHELAFPAKLWEHPLRPRSLADMRVLYRSTVPERKQAFLQMCELSRAMHLVARGSVPQHAAEVFRARGAATLLPAWHLREQVRRHRGDIEAVLACFPDVAETCVLLRLAELGLCDVLVLDAIGRIVRHVRTRRATPWRILGLASQVLRGSSNKTNVRAVRLTDAPDRVGLVTSGAA
jgi:hypothetical protein